MKYLNEYNGRVAPLTTMHRPIYPITSRSNGNDIDIDIDIDNLFPVQANCTQILKISANSDNQE